MKATAIIAALNELIAQNGGQDIEVEIGNTDAYVQPIATIDFRQVDQNDGEIGVNTEDLADQSNVEREVIIQIG
jgi:hypothetical protein